MSELRIGLRETDYQGAYEHDFKLEAPLAISLALAAPFAPNAVFFSELLPIRPA